MEVQASSFDVYRHLKDMRLIVVEFKINVTEIMFGQMKVT